MPCANLEFAEKKSVRAARKSIMAWRKLESAVWRFLTADRSVHPCNTFLLVFRLQRNHLSDEDIRKIINNASGIKSSQTDAVVHISNVDGSIAMDFKPLCGKHIPQPTCTCPLLSMCWIFFCAVKFGGFIFFGGGGFFSHTHRLHFHKQKKNKGRKAALFGQRGFFLQ